MRTPRLPPSSLVVALVAACSSVPPPHAAPTPQPQAAQASTLVPPPEPPPPPPPKHVDPPKIGIVLGGGGARGFAHLGFLRILEQEKIPIDLIVGTSVGSLIGAMYAAQPKAFELELKAFRISRDDFFDFSLFAATTGPVKGEAIQEFVRRNVALQEIERFPIRYVAIAADLNTGERVEFTRGSIVDAVRASVSIPGVFTPARIGNRTLVDGGVVANLAVDVARAHGADIVIASDIGQGVVNYKIGNVVDIILQSINIMMAEMSRVQAARADVVVVPKIGDVGTLDFDQQQRCMRAGIEATEAALPALKAAIAKYYLDRGGVPPPEYAPSISTASPGMSPAAATGR